MNRFASHIALTILICCLVRLSGYPDGEKHCSNPGYFGASEGAGETADTVRLSIFLNRSSKINQELWKTSQTELRSAQVENSFLRP